MKRLLTAAQMRALEEHSEKAGVSQAVLMEAAGLQLAEATLGLMSSHGRCFVFCGTGNNGGDGMVAARHLANRGRTVFVEQVGDPSKRSVEANRNASALEAAGLVFGEIDDSGRPGPGDVIIDALFGTGLSRPAAGPFAEAIERINAFRQKGAKVVSVDLPSGVQSDSGKVFFPAVQADHTVCFGERKVGLYVEPGASQAGKVACVDIGLVPGSSLNGPSTWLVEEMDAKTFPARQANTHKGTYGHVLVIAGSRGKSGAAALAGKAALVGGAGLCTVATRADVLSSVLAHAPEMMGVDLRAEGALSLFDLNALSEAAEGKSAVVIGPGIHVGEDTAKLLGAFLEEIEIPCVLDAAALNAVAADPGLLSRAKGALLLTPHPGEMARLCGKSAKEVQEDRLGVGRTFAQAHEVTVILKGARSLICGADGNVYVNPTGNPGMATAGTGDVLAGLCGALLAQGLGEVQAALTATYAHGLAGDLAAARTGQLGLCASDLFSGLKEAWVRWDR